MQITYLRDVTCIQLANKFVGMHGCNEEASRRDGPRQGRLLRSVAFPYDTTFPPDASLDILVSEMCSSQVLLLVSHMALATSLLCGRFPKAPKKAHVAAVISAWDKAYVVGAGAIFVLGELVHPVVFGPGGIGGEGRLPFLPLMAYSVYGAVGVSACWVLSWRGVGTAS